MNNVSLFTHFAIILICFTELTLLLPSRFTISQILWGNLFQTAYPSGCYSGRSVVLHSCHGPCPFTLCILGCFDDVFDFSSLSLTPSFHLILSFRLTLKILQSMLFRAAANLFYSSTSSAPSLSTLNLLCLLLTMSLRIT